MFSNHIKLIVRNLLKNKLFTIMTLTGLSIGIACVIFISLYVAGELSYDRHWAGADRIHRVALERIYPERVKNFASASVMLAPTLAAEIPSIESATRLHRLFFQNDVLTRVGDKDFVEAKFLFADSNYFKVFNYDFVDGSEKRALNDRTSVVITESTARRYFGRSDVAGESIRLDTLELTVSGVVKDQLPTTHIQFDLLGSIEALPFLHNAIVDNNWVLAWVYTYIKIRENSDVTNLQSDIQRFADRNAKASIAANYGTAEGHHFNYYLQPVTSIHLHSGLDVEVSPNSSIEYVYLLIIIAVIILAITTINYISFSVSRLGDRSKEVGIRKTLGAKASEIRLQIFGESFLLCVAGTIISVAVVFLLWNKFMQLTGRSFTPAMVLSPMHGVYLIAFILLLSVIAGIYPSSAFATLQPTKALKGEYKVSNKNIRLRNVLMIVQFSISIAMITGSMAVFRQMQYLNSKDLGFSPANVIALRKAQNLGNNFRPFLNKISQLPGVKKIAYSAESALPGNQMGSVIFKSITNPDVSEVRVNTTFFSADFLETLDYRIAEGRGFSESFRDSLGVLINQAAAKAFQLENPVGAKIHPLTPGNTGPELTVVGIVEDYNFFSLHVPITPLVIFRIPSTDPGSAIAIRIEAHDFERTMSDIRESWTAMSDSPIDFSAIDQDIARMYQSDRTTLSVFNIFTVIAISMSCLGLLGLTSYLAQQRLKEMSIRRIMGATHADVLFTFASPFVRLTCVSMIIAFALSFYFIREWLSTYAYHAGISIMTYVWTALLALVILMVSLSAQFVRLLRLDTVKLLKEN